MFPVQKGCKTGAIYHPFSSDTSIHRIVRDLSLSHPYICGLNLQKLVGYPFIESLCQLSHDHLQLEMLFEIS